MDHRLFASQIAVGMEIDRILDGTTGSWTELMDVFRHGEIDTL
jgi:hypothetical protein